MPTKKKPVKKSTKIDVQVVPIDSIKLWGKNPRTNDHAVEPLAKILDKHGQRSPVVVWRKNNTIYKGNTTWKALKKLGYPEIKVQFEDFESEAAATAYGIADNKAGEFSDWDDNVLLELLSAEEFASVRKDMGFSEQELKGLEMVPDIDKIGKMKETDTGIRATVKIHCKPEDRDEVRDMLAEWAKDSGFEEIVVK